jgi:hypothetical protein
LLVTELSQVSGILVVTSADLLACAHDGLLFVWLAGRTGPTTAAG